jgi:hypothetical protein
MERIEYRDIVGKQGWAPGEWHSEPDKIQWADEATGLPCLIVRGPVGALCGYVGVQPGHALHGKGYDDCDVEAHGGLTFAGGCTEISREKWEKWRERKPSLIKEAAQYPVGDAARSLKEWEGCWDDYNAWAIRAHARFICHTPGPNEPDRVWWFGFDCAHSGDICPRMSSIGVREMMGFDGETYKSVSYVANECRMLATQLAKMQ